MSQLPTNGHPETSAEPNSGSSYTPAFPKKPGVSSRNADGRDQVFTPPIVIEENVDLQDNEAALQPGPVVVPPIKISLINKVYGRYSGQSLPYEVELRVDIDGPSA